MHTLVTIRTPVRQSAHTIWSVELHQFQRYEHIWVPINSP